MTFDVESNPTYLITTTTITTMSFLTQTLARRATVIPRAATAVSARHFTTSLAAQKTMTESAKDGMKTVDRAVSDKLVDGLDAASS